MQRTFHKGLSRRLINAVMSATIKRGMGPSQRYLLTVVGRKTKTPHTTPVSLVIEGPTRYLVGPYGEVAWVRNARAAGVVTLARGSESERFALAELSAPEAGPILGRYLKLEPITRPYFDVSADASPEALEGQVAGHPVFRLTPAAT